MAVRRVGVLYESRWLGCRICVAKSVCVGWLYIYETPVGTAVLPQIGELPVHLSLGEVLLLPDSLSW